MSTVKSKTSDVTALSQLKNVIVAGAEDADYPEMAHAYLDYAEHLDGTPVTEAELLRLSAVLQEEIADEARGIILAARDDMFDTLFGDLTDDDDYLLED